MKKNLSFILLLILTTGCNINKNKLSSTYDVWGNISQTSSLDNNSASSVESSESSNLSSSELTNSSSSNETLIQGQYDAPTEGYALQITPASGSKEYFVILNYHNKKDDYGREQYFGDDVVLNKGDLFKMYNGSAGEYWASIEIEKYGQYSNFLSTNNGIQVLVSGTYDIYAKLMYGNDVMYIGNNLGQ